MPSIISWFTVALVALGTVAGCGGKADDSSGQSPDGGGPGNDGGGDATTDAPSSDGARCIEATCNERVPSGCGECRFAPPCGRSGVKVCMGSGAHCYLDSCIVVDDLSWEEPCERETDGLPCFPESSCCGEACVLLSEPEHCGGCAVVCSPNDTCVVVADAGTPAAYECVPM